MRAKSDRRSYTIKLARLRTYRDLHLVCSVDLFGTAFLLLERQLWKLQPNQIFATLEKLAVEQVELEFPSQGPGGQPGRTAASRVDLGPASRGVDVAVLDLGEDRPGWLPAPVPVWPAARPPARVQVFGYPLAERLLKGVWRQVTVAGPAAAGCWNPHLSNDGGQPTGSSARRAGSKRRSDKPGSVRASSR